MSGAISIRARVLLLVVVSALPGLVLMLYIQEGQRQLYLQLAREEMSRRVELVEALLPAFQLGALAGRGAETLGRGQILTLIDEHGLVIVQHPAVFARPGDRFPDEALLEGLRRGDTFFDLPDPAGVRRLYAAREWKSAGGSPVTVVISMPRAIALEHLDAALAWSVGGILLATSALLPLVWLGFDRLILAPIRLMLDMTRRVRSGDLSARTGMRAGREELSQLGAALDAMARQLDAREGALRSALEEKTQQALTDPLTGLYNRRFFQEALQRQIAAATRTGTPFSVILFDLDRFKAVNDAFGHEAGDRVLQEAARVLTSSIRASDFGVRHGGEEFAVLLPETDLAVASERAEQIRAELEAHDIVDRDRHIRVTASFGVAQWQPGADAAALLAAVDAAMYAAKDAGRNRVVVAESSGTARSGVSPLFQG